MTPTDLNIRLGLYVSIAILTTLLSNPDALHKASSWLDWFVILGAAILQGLIVARAFIDKSSGQPGASTGSATTQPTVTPTHA